jgi:RHS repeat-associated protein
MTAIRGTSTLSISWSENSVERSDPGTGDWQPVALGLQSASQRDLSSGAARSTTIGTPAEPTTNRLTGYGYDSNGNQISTGYTYDAEDRIVFANAGTVEYFYDGQNKRIWQANYPNGLLTSDTVTLFGADGKQVSTYSAQISQTTIGLGMQAERVYFAGKLVGQLNTGGTVSAAVQDRLGSVGKYYPYGEQRNVQQPTNQTLDFATCTRDSATGLDYADQRYYASTFGRFMTPDPYKANNGGSSDPSDSASWNRYSYTRADPVNRFDPRGFCDVTDGFTGWGGDDGDPDPDQSGIPPQCLPSQYYDSRTNRCIAYLEDWIILGEDSGRPTSEAGRLRDYIWLNQDWAALKNFTTTNQNCLDDLSKFGLTPPGVQNAARRTTLVDLSSLPQDAQSQFDPGPDFTARLNARTGFRAIVYNRTEYWQSTSSEMADTLLHEILHLSSVGNFNLKDAQIANRLGVTITAADDSNISKKLANDCFPTPKNWGDKCF